MNLDELTQRLHRIRDNNDWKQFHSPKNLAMAASVEMAELVEIFQWLSEDQSRQLPAEKLAKLTELKQEYGQVVMVGDDMHNDVLGAQAAALMGVLVRTGKFREEALRALQRDEFGPVPDHIIGSLTDLPALMEKLDGE